MVKKTLYFGSPAYLSIKNKQLIIKKRSDEVTSVSLEDVSVIVLDNQQITITMKVFQECLNNNVAIITCNYSHMPEGMFLSFSQNYTQTQRYLEQIKVSEPTKKQIWKQTIEFKVETQIRLLKYFGKDYRKIE